MRNTSATVSGIVDLSDVRPSFRHLTGIDWGLLVVVLVLSFVGLLTVHSASAELAVDYLPRQGGWVLLGLGVLTAMLVLDYHLLTSLSPFLWVLSLILLGLVLLTGEEAGGARSWLAVGSWRFQPSELAKLATALFLTNYLASANRRYLTLGQIVLACAIAAPPTILVVLQPDLGGAAMYFPLLATLLLVGGVRLHGLIAAALLVILIGIGIWHVGMHDYQRQRVESFLSPESDPLGAGYQVRQSKIAVGSGQLLGRGHMQGPQSHLRFLPARHTDFILAVLAEEWGFLGVATALGLYMLLIVNGARIAMRARDRAGILLVTGLLAVMTAHVVYNAAMVIGLLPITGVPIPFLSYGGSFMLFNYAAVGLMLSVDLRRYVNR